MQQISQFIQEAPGASVFISLAVPVLSYLGVRLFNSGLVRHFKNFGK